MGTTQPPGGPLVGALHPKRVGDKTSTVPENSPSLKLSPVQGTSRRLVAVIAVRLREKMLLPLSLAVPSSTGSASEHVPFSCGEITFHCEYTAVYLPPLC